VRKHMLSAAQMKAIAAERHDAVVGVTPLFPVPGNAISNEQGVQITLGERAWFVATAYSRFGNPIAKEPAASYEGRFLVTSAPNTITRMQLGVSDRRAQACPLHRPAPMHLGRLQHPARARLNTIGLCFLCAQVGQNIAVTVNRGIISVNHWTIATYGDHSAEVLTHPAIA
jgi:hypothetical protein